MTGNLWMVPCLTPSYPNSRVCSSRHLHYLNSVQLRLKTDLRGTISQMVSVAPLPHGRRVCEYLYLLTWLLLELFLSLCALASCCDVTDSLCAT